MDQLIGVQPQSANTFGYIFVIFTVLMAIYAFALFLNLKLLKKQIEFRNQLQGTKSNITPVTLKTARIMSLVVAIAALLMAWFGYSNFVSNVYSALY